MQRRAVLASASALGATFLSGLGLRTASAALRSFVGAHIPGSALVLGPSRGDRATRYFAPLLSRARSANAFIHDPGGLLHTMCSTLPGPAGEAPVQTRVVDWTSPQSARINLLGPDYLPAGFGERGPYLDRLALTLLGARSPRGDGFFVDRARSALVGLASVLVDMTSIGPDSYARAVLPAELQAREPSLPVLASWLVHLRRRQGEDPSATLASQLGPVLDHGESMGYFSRGLREVRPLVLLPDKELSGVLATLENALLPFRNEVVAANTSLTDLPPDVLFGTTPSRIFLRSFSSDTLSCSRLSSAFVETLADLALRRTLPADPRGVLFVLLDLAMLERMPAVADGLDLGRSREVYFHLGLAGEHEMRHCFGSVLDHIVGSPACPLIRVG